MRQIEIIQLNIFPIAFIFSVALFNSTPACLSKNDESLDDSEGQIIA